MRWSLSHIVLFTVLVANASLGTELENLELVQEFEDSDGGSAQITYAAVPGFALQQGATSVAGKDKDGCAAVCTGEPTCKSFSYDAKAQTCLWSVDALNFDPAFVMKTKAHHSSNAFKEWRTFEGLTYRATGWLKATGKTLDQCEDLCKKSTSCEALSYREEDMVCLLSPKGVHYAPDYTYYEKTGNQMATMPVTSQGGAKMPSDETATDDATKTNNAAEVSALMNAESAKLNSANDEISEANEIEQKSKAAVSGEESEMHSEVARARAQAAADLKKQEDAFTSQQSEKMSEEESTLRLQFASDELKEKADTEEGQAGRERERTEKSASDVQAHAAREAARAVAEGAEQAAQRVETAQLEQKQSQAQEEISDADERSQKARLEGQSAIDEVEATKEVAEKRTEEAEKEIEEKKAALVGKSESEQKRGYKEIEEAKEKATAGAQQRTIEIEAKESQRSTERGEKAKQQTEQEEKGNKAAIAQSIAERKMDEDAKEAEDAKLTQMQKDEMLARMDANKMAANSVIAGEEQNLQEQKALNAAEMDFQKKQLGEQIRAKMEKEAAEEVEQQREDVARKAARRVADASKDEADRVATEANNAVKRKEIEEKGRVADATRQIKADEKVEEDRTDAERRAQELRIDQEKARGDDEAKQIEEEAKDEVKAINNQAAADAKAKKDTADADARLTEARAKEIGEKQAADVTEAADQAALISTMTIKADMGTFVSSGLNPGTESYQDLENNANAAATTATEEETRAATAKEAADTAAAEVTSQEVHGKELAEKSAAASVAASTAASTNAATTASTAAAAAAAASFTGGGGRRLLAANNLDDKLRFARQRAVRAMRRLLQTSSTTAATTIADNAANTINDANAASGAASEAGVKAATASQLANTAQASTQGANEASTKSSASTAANAAEVGTKEVSSKADAQTAEIDAKATSATARTTADQAQAAAETQQAALNAANLLPANTPYGKLPEMYEHKGYFRIQGGGPMEQSAFLKFPTTNIRSIDAVIGATMRLYKTGGGGGPAVIKLASCAFTRNTLTYTSSETLPQGTASEGVTAVFPEESDMWASIQLKSAVIQAARANGDHLCFEVTGGPKDEPAILSSELTSKGPELKLEIQSPPKTEAEKAIEVEKKEAEARKLQAESDMEEHLKTKYTDEATASALADKAAALVTETANIQSEFAQKELDQTSGDAFESMKAQNDADRVQKISQLETEANAEIDTTEDQKAETTLANSGLIGSQLETLRSELYQHRDSEKASQKAAKKTSIEAAQTKWFLDKLTNEIESKKATLAAEMADKVTAATAAASRLTAPEEEAVKAAADAKAASSMVDWKAGTLVDPTAPASVHDAAAEQAMSQLQSGVTEEDRAQMQQRVSDQVQSQLQTALSTAVSGKIQQAESTAIAEIKSKMEADAQTQLSADIARESAGKSDAEIATITGTLTGTSETNVAAAITLATTGPALTALKSKLQGDLTEQMKPGILAHLRATITKAEVAQMNADATAKLNAQSDAVANGITAQTGASDTELGSTLDIAPERHSPQ